MKFLFVICLTFVIGCNARDLQPTPDCLFESEICLGSTLEEIQNVFPNLIKKDKGKYQYLLLDQNYSKKELPNIYLFRMTYFKFDDENYLEKFVVSFMDLDIRVPNYWQELLLTIGKDQLAHYGIKDLDWERPASHEEEIITQSGLRIVHKFQVSDYDEVVRIEVGSAN